MSDLELLELLEKAKEKQRGPKGETGVGITSIEQFDDTSFTIRLTDGSFKKVDLPTAKDGEVGPQGIQGERGEPGPGGRPGRDGAAGVDGRDGIRGLPGVSVDTAVVNGSGHLLIGLTDGSVVDVGRVVGPVGATGERGSAGLPGKSGADGAAVLSGPRTPTQDDGKEGDHWIDVSTAEFNFYKKSGTGWTMLASLRSPGKNPAVAVPVGGSGGSGGSGSVGTFTSDVKLTHPTRGAKDLPSPGSLKTQEDANQYFIKAVEHAMVSVSEEPPENPVVGELWWSTAGDELTLYVYVSGL